MSPKIWANGNLVANIISDDTGRREMLDGSPVDINTDQIEATRDKQIIIVTSDQLGGRRVIGLTQEGRGSSSDPKRGDGLEPELHVLLSDSPIRISYRDQVWHERPRTLAGPNDGGWYEEHKRTYLNPRWIRGRERE